MRTPAPTDLEGRTVFPRALRWASLAALIFVATGGCRGDVLPPMPTAPPSEPPPRGDSRPLPPPAPSGTEGPGEGPAYAPDASVTPVGPPVSPPVNPPVNPPTMADVDAGPSVPPVVAPPADAGAAPADTGPVSAPQPPPPGSALPGWKLVWSDEFTGPAGGAPDATKWRFMIGTNSANQELQYYTNRRENSALDGTGNLVITARREAFMNQAYTSARMSTGGSLNRTYGRFETRAKLPAGQGVWSAFWMLGSNYAQAGWPGCGEIDILENIGRDTTINYASLHGPGYSAGAALTASYRLPAGQSFNTSFHRFAVEWEPNVVRFYVDDTLFQTRTAASLAGRTWVYDHPFHLILNLAIGGGFPGNPNATTVFPQSFVVDYVRVYER